MHENRTDFFHWFLFENYNDETKMFVPNLKKTGKTNKKGYLSFTKSCKSCKAVKHQAYTTLPLNVEQ